jgi:GNAT superfamily N-acetyltransferase
MTNPEAINFANFTKLASTDSETFTAAITKKKEDRFANTFVAKCNMMDAWDKCVGAYIDGKLAGAIVVTVSKRNPKVANLQLLHSFHEYRGRGVGKLLCQHALDVAIYEKCEYFRVSAEPDAVVFYEKCGMKFLGKQKSGSQLSMFRISSPRFQRNDYAPDAYIYKQMIRKGKGGCVEMFVDYKGVDFFSE